MSITFMRDRSWNQACAYCGTLDEERILEHVHNGVLFSHIENNIISLQENRTGDCIKENKPYSERRPPDFLSFVDPREGIKKVGGSLLRKTKGIQSGEGKRGNINSERL